MLKKQKPKFLVDLSSGLLRMAARNTLISQEVYEKALQESWYVDIDIDNELAKWLSKKVLEVPLCTLRTHF